MLFFFLGDVEATNQLLEKHWPEARAVSDPDEFFFKGFGLDNMTWKQVLHPGSFFRAAGALLKGHGLGPPRGQNPFMRSAALLVENQEIRWRHDYRHAGDHPDFGQFATQ